MITDCPRDSLMSFTRLAGLLNETYGLSIDRRQVEAWQRRKTRNAAGVQFPQPVYEDRHAGGRRPRRFTSSRAVIEWYAAGMPEHNPNQHTWKEVS